MTLPVDPSRYLAFLGVMAVMAATPGPANLFSVATGVDKGRSSALLAVLGMNLASLVWYAGAALGLGALVAAFPQVFRLLRIAGALYLVWLAAKALMAAATGGETGAHLTRKPGRSSLRDGFAVQIANPKIVLFFTAVLPPFVDLHRPLVPQLALFACAMLAMDGTAMSAYGLFGAALAGRMQEPRFRRGFSALVGLLLLAAAALIASRG